MKTLKKFREKATRILKNKKGAVTTTELIAWTGAISIILFLAIVAIKSSTIDGTLKQTTQRMTEMEDVLKK